MNINKNRDSQNPIKQQQPRIEEVIMSGGLIVIGTAFLLAVFNNAYVEAYPYIWPVFIIIPGLLVIDYAMTIETYGDASAIIGSILLIVGLLLFLHPIVNPGLWFLLSLLAIPIAIILGLSLWMLRIDREESLNNKGFSTATNLIILFIIGIALEILILLTRFLGGLGFFLWPLITIGCGAWILVQRLQSS